jgi:hypothetical protein
VHAALKAYLQAKANRHLTHLLKKIVGFHEPQSLQAEISVVKTLIRQHTSGRMPDYELVAYQAAQIDSHQIILVRLVAEIVANNEELHIAGIKFRYRLPVNSSTTYRCRRPLILGIEDVHISAEAN